MAKRAGKATEPDRLSAAEVAMLERLIEKGALVAKPQQPNARPRKVMAAALSRDGRHIILWLSKNTMSLDET
jgi:ribosomal protein S12